MGRGRWTGADQKVGKILRRRFRLSGAEQSECPVKPIDRDRRCNPALVRCRWGFAWQNSRSERISSGRAMPQPAQCKKRNCKQQGDCLGASQRSARHFRHQRVEQIGKNRSDRHRDQDWLRKLMILAPVQITAARITIRTTTKNAVRAAHIILRCQGVGYSFISQRRQNIERVRGSCISPGLRRSMFAIR